MIKQYKAQDFMSTEQKSKSFYIRRIPKQMQKRVSSYMISVKKK